MTDDKSYAPIEAGRHLTGKNARLQVASLYAQFRKDPKANQHIALPVEARQQRRAAKAEDRRQGRKGRRAFVRQERAKEQAASDLANLFALADAGNVRAVAAIDARVEYLFEEQAKAQGTLPDSLQIQKQLRDIAKTGVVPVPKGQRPSKAEVLRDFAQRELVRQPVDAITTGRTGRAG